MPRWPELRPVTDDDREFLFRLYASTRQDELSVVPWSDEQKESFLRSQFDAQTRSWGVDFPDASFNVIEVGGERAGRLYVQQREEELRIVDIALLPEYRGQGIGRVLLEQILAQARESGRAVRIHVEKNNPAYRLYLRLGFRMSMDKGVYDLLEWRPGADSRNLSSTTDEPGTI